MHTTDTLIETLVAARKEREARWDGHPVYAVAREVAGRLASRIDHGDTMFVSGNIRRAWEMEPCTVIDYLRNPTFGDVALASPYQVWVMLYFGLVSGPDDAVIASTGMSSSQWAESLASLGTCPSR